MKRYIVLFFIIILLVSTSCKKKNSPTFNNDSIDVVINAGEEYLIEPITNNIDNPQFDIEIQSLSDKSYEDIVSYDNFKVKGLSEGKVKVSVKLDGFEPWIITISVLSVELREIKLDYTELSLALGEKINVQYHLVPDIKADLNFTSSSKNIAVISETGEITAVNPGTCNITIRSKDNFDLFARFKLIVYIPDVTEITTPNETINLGFDESYQLNWQVLPIKSNQDVRLSSSNENVVTVDDNGILRSHFRGEATIKVESISNPNIFKEVKVVVDGPIATSLSLSSESLNLEIGKKVEFSYEILPANAYQHLEISYEGNDAFELLDGYIIAYKSGNYSIKFKTIDGSEFEKTLALNVKKEDNPVFRVHDNYHDEETINWNYDFDPLYGVYAYDSEDGNITNNIKVSGQFDSKTLGTYSLTYTVKDKDGHSISMNRIINVKWLYHTMVIGHAGSYYGVMNSEEAILVGARDMHYPAIEIDVKQTKDGVFVLSHDPDFGGYQLEEHDYEFFKNIEVTVTRNKGLVPLNESERTYTAKLCTLERYLEICKQYNIIGVIELKTSNGISNWTEQNNPSGSRMQALMDVVDSVGMSHNIIFLSSQYECLNWTRKNGYEYIPCQYLVNDLSNMDYYNICRKYNLDISTNVRDGIKISDGWLNIYKNAGIKISTYTFEEYASYEDVQTWIDRGVDFVTCDWHDMTKLKFE